MAVADMEVNNWDEFFEELSSLVSEVASRDCHNEDTSATFKEKIDF